MNASLIMMERLLEILIKTIITAYLLLKLEAYLTLKSKSPKSLPLKIAIKQLNRKHIKFKHLLQ